MSTSVIGCDAVANSHRPASPGSSQAWNTRSGGTLKRRATRIAAGGAAIDRDRPFFPELGGRFMVSSGSLKWFTALVDRPGPDSTRPARAVRKSPEEADPSAINRPVPICCPVAAKA
jgi:hypothetical protein